MKSESATEQSKDLKRDIGLPLLQEKQLSSGRKRSNGKIGWQQKVYKIGKNESESLQDFHKVSVEVFKRDGYACESCFKTRYKLSREDKFLTCHHILPREDGGQNGMDNLITLCNTCHDIIEEKRLKTKSDIYGFLSEDKRHWHRESNTGMKWQQWVYGGYHRPNK